MSFDLKSSIKRAKRTQRGLTLIELIVVLVILVGLGGLLVPTISNALTRTHVATCASTFPEVHQMMQRVELEFGNFGTNYDSGIYTGGSTPVNNSADTLNNFNGGAGGNGPLQALPLSAAEAASLVAVGIDTVVDHAATPTNVTFAIDGVPRAIGDGADVITLTDAQARGIFLPAASTAATGAPAGQKYIWLGIGRNWSLLSELTPEPPVHFGDAQGALADQVYSRFGIVMQVADANGAPLERAEFKRVSFCIDGELFETADNHIENYYREVNPRGT